MLFCSTFASDVKTRKLTITNKLTKRCKCAQKRKFNEVFTWVSKGDQTHSIDEVCIGIYDLSFIHLSNAGNRIKRRPRISAALVARKIK